MVYSPPSWRPALGLWLLSLTSTSAQSVPGARLLQGGGAPGAAPYELVDDYSASVFFSKFNYYDSYDPTYGHVQYVNESVAVSNGYTYYSQASDSAVIKPDTVGIWPNGGLGRPSIRITSDNTYNHGLFIMDLKHMPAGCGTWPAYWLLGPDWPYTGEIDIIEGTNTAEINTVSLHSTSECTIAGSGQTGTFETSICDVNQNGNSGCGSQLTNTTALPNNYGSSFNDNEGGVYATEWTSEYIKTWWFPRGHIPDSIAFGSPDVAEFGTPAVNAQGDCEIDARFQNMSVIINIDFCGAWAGNVYFNSYPNCPQSANAANDPIGSCVDYVGNNPDKLGEAYFEINSLKVYQMPNDVAPTSSYSTSLSSVTPVATSNSIPLGMGATTSTISSAPPFTGSVAGPAATNPPSICPQYDKSIIVNSNDQQDLIYCGFDWTGPNLGIPDTSASFDACLVRCDNTAGCESVTYTGGNGSGFCYLKPVGATLTENSNVNAARRVNGASSGSSSTTLSASTLGSTSTSSPSSTITTVGTPVASTTTSAHGGVATVAASAASCPQNNMDHVVDNCGVEYIMSCGTDTSSGSFTGVQVTSFNACFEICSSGAQGACSAFGYETDSKFCYLKGGTNEHFQDQNPRVIGAIQAAYLNSPNAPSNSVSRSCIASTVSFPSSTRATADDSTAPSSSSTATLTNRSVTGLETFSATSSISTAMSSTATASASSLPVPSSSVPAVSLPSLISSVLSAASTIASGTPFTSVGASSIQTAPIATSAVDASSTSAASQTTSSANMPSSIRVPGTITTHVGSVSVTFCPDCVAPTASSTAFPTAPSGTTTACPTQTAAICGAKGEVQEPMTCSSPGDTTYTVLCGIIYTGTEIPDDQVSIIRNNTSLASRPVVAKRFPSPNFGACQTACDNTDGCIALNYAGTNCTLFSAIDGTSLLSGAVSAAQVPDGPNEGDDEPICPESTGMKYTTSNDVNYTISCSYRYDGSNINVFPADAFSDCLPSCDAARNCVGVQYDTNSGVCYLKSFFPAPSYDTTGSFVVGIKAAVTPGSSTSISTSSSTFSSAASLSAGSAISSAFSSVAGSNMSSIASNMSSVEVPTMTATTGITTIAPATTVTPSGDLSGVVTATTVIVSTLPPGASITTVSNGSSTGSFYVFTTTSAPLTTGGGSTPTGSCTEEICFNCGLIPIVTTNCGGSTTTIEPPTDIPTPTTIATTVMITSGGVTYTTMAPSATASVECPKQTSSLCASNSKKSSCSSLGGSFYELTCGIIVLGIEILDKLINVLDKRVIAADLGSCLSACDSTASCVPFNYVEYECTLFSSLSGTSILAGAVSGVKLGTNGGDGGLTTMTITSYPETCPVLTASGTGTTTVYNTFTITSCAAQPICPNPGYVIIGGTATVPGGVVVTTTNGNGITITYTQIQTSNLPYTTTNSNGNTVVYTQTAAPIYSGGPVTGPGTGAATGPGSRAGSGAGTGPGTGAGTGPGTGFNTITETTKNSNGITYYITKTPTPIITTAAGTGPGTGPGTGAGTGAGTGLGTEVATPTTGGPTTTVTTTALPTCPFANGQVYVDALGFSYIIVCDTAYSGLLLNTVSIADTGTLPRLSDCIAACDAYNLQNAGTTQCEGVSLDSNVVSDNCALVGGLLTSTPKAGVYSGIVLRAVVGPGGTTIVTGGGGSPTTVVGPASTNTVTTTTVSISVQTTTDVITTGGTGAGTGPGNVVTSYVPSTVYGVSTVFSTVVSNGVTVIQTYGISTVITISFVPATATTVTTTERTFSDRITTVLSNGVTTVIVPSTIVGPTVTTNGGTITQAGPTVTATGPGGTNGGTATVSQTTTTTVISYVLPSSTSRGTSSSVCRLTATNYLRGALPVRRIFFDVERNLAGDELLPKPGAMPIL